MLKSLYQIVVFVSFLSLFFGCPAKTAPPQGEIQDPPPVGSISGTAAGQGGQIPGEIVSQASEVHGGSMIAAQSSQGSGLGNGQVSGEQAGNAGTITMILGPVNAERVVNSKDVSGDAGQSIRETISQKLTASKEVSLFDAPEERFIDDSPRLDLSRRGVKFVIKGVASTGSDSGETTVFLRAVDTMTGKVAMVASARHPSRNQAAADAAQRLLKKITGGE